MRLSLLWVLLLVTPSCTSKDPDVECRLRPAFSLRLSAVQGSLPADTLLRVKYGGGVEEYRVSDSVQTQKVVFCQRRSTDGGPLEAGVSADEIACELWTQGAATVTVESSPYPTLEEPLEAEADGRCIRTVEVDLVLGETDAGT